MAMADLFGAVGRGLSSLGRGAYRGMQALAGGSQTPPPNDRFYPTPDGRPIPSRGQRAMRGIGNVLGTLGSVAGSVDDVVEGRPPRLSELFRRPPPAAAAPPRRVKQPLVSPEEADELQAIQEVSSRNLGHPPYDTSFLPPQNRLRGLTWRR